MFVYVALRVNEPPVAVIVPSSQTVHLPNNVAILDGRTSTDDTKIVSYKWNLEKGPISYQFEPKSQITLELNGVTPTTKICWSRNFNHFYDSRFRFSTRKLHFRFDGDR